MPRRNAMKTVRGVCPGCGPSRIGVLLEGGTYAITAEGPNKWGSVWFGQCCRCRAYLEADLDDEDGDDLDRLEWTPVEAEKVEFLFGSRPVPEAPPLDPLWDRALDG